MATTISYPETIAIQAFLGYLNKHYSKQINNKDVALISAVAAWVAQESGSLKNVVGNNPFNIRISPFAVSYRQTNGNGKFAVFASLSKGFEAAAYLLMHGNKTYGYQLALNALKHGGNQAAYDFLAALAMSSWDAGHYGVTTWQQAYDPKVNHLLRNYVGISGVYLQNPHPHPKPAKHRPVLPRDFNYNVVVRQYLDPYAARDRYVKRHARALDVTQSKR